MNADEVDRQRSRWRGWRQALHLSDASDPEFGGTGLAARIVEEPAVRFLVLPPDPFANLVDFDEAFWTWWGALRQDPAAAGPMGWGTAARPSASAALLVRAFYNGHADSYIALHRSGSLELELGRDGKSAAGEHDYVRLLTTVGRTWAALELYRSVAERYSLDGPFEVTLAVRQTEGALLADFAQGWAGPGDIHFPTAPCSEANLLLSLEMDAWPDLEVARETAFRFGAWLEDCWGRTERRFLAHTGERLGQFDSGRYGWS